jgi:hypothetical protein
MDEARNFLPKGPLPGSLQKMRLALLLVLASIAAEQVFVSLAYGSAVGVISEGKMRAKLSGARAQKDNDDIKDYSRALEDAAGDGDYAQASVMGKAQWYLRLRFITNLVRFLGCAVLLLLAFSAVGEGALTPWQKGYALAMAVFAFLLLYGQIDVPWDDQALRMR